MRSWNLQKIKNSIQSNQYLPYFALILITLLLYTCSPIYINERGNVDIDTSFAVSNAMRHGYVLGRDIFEQRGLYFYFLILPSTLFDTFHFQLLWIWIIEVLSTFVAYYNIKPILGKRNALIAIILYILLINTDDIGEPDFLIMAINGFLMRIALTNTNLSKKYTLILGLILGFLIEFKFALIIPTCAIFLVFGLKMLWNKQFKQFFETVLIAVSGLLLAQIPMLIYTLTTGSLHDYMLAYFIENVGNAHFYIFRFIKIVLTFLFDNMFIILILAVPFHIGLKQFPKFNQIAFITLFSLEILRIIGVGFYTAYYNNALIFFASVIAMKGLIAILDKTSTTNSKLYKSIKYASLIILTSLCISVTYSIYNHIQVNELNTSSKKVGEYIKQNGQGDVLTYASLDFMQYIYSQTYPTVRYFDQTNISYRNRPQSFNAQLSYIKNKRTRWVTQMVDHGYKDMYRYADVYQEFIRYNRKLFVLKTFDGPSRPFKCYVPKVLIKNYDPVFVATDYNRDSEGYQQAKTILWERKKESSD